MPLLSGAEPFVATGGPTGVLLCHGFTGSPQSLRPWAEHLADAGLTARLPRLPGHGTDVRKMAMTRWPDWYAALARALDDLAQSCSRIVVGGLSMGGTLALRLAEVQPDRVDALVLVNPSLEMRHPLVPLLPALQHLVPTIPGIGSDIRRPGVSELAYDRVPLRALASLADLWRVTRRDLALVRAPVLMFRSVEDHVVAPGSAALLRAALPPGQLEERLLSDSYHVATLDDDAPAIFAATVALAAGSPDLAGAR